MQQVPELLHSSSELLVQVCNGMHLWQEQKKQERIAEREAKEKERKAKAKEQEKQRVKEEKRRAKEAKKKEKADKEEAERLRKVAHAQGT